MTGNIGVHHIHHLASRIPSYRLSEVLDDHPQLRNISRLTLRQSLELFRCALCVFSEAGGEGCNAVR